jgi:hypothetical protein
MITKITRNRGSIRTVWARHPEDRADRPPRHDEGRRGGTGLGL